MREFVHSGVSILCVAFHSSRLMTLRTFKIKNWVFTQPPVRKRRIVINMSGLSVCPHAYLRKHTSAPYFSKFSVHVACGHGSALFWRLCNTLCISGSVDDVVLLSPWRRDTTEAASPQCRARFNTPRRRPRQD